MIKESSIPDIRDLLSCDDYKYFCVTCSKGRKQSSSNQNRCFDESEAPCDDEANDGEEVKVPNEADQIHSEHISPFTLGTHLDCVD